MRKYFYNFILIKLLNARPKISNILALILLFILSLPYSILAQLKQGGKNEPISYPDFEEIRRDYIKISIPYWLRKDFYEGKNFNESLELYLNQLESSLISPTQAYIGLKWGVNQNPIPQSIVEMLLEKYIDFFARLQTHEDEKRKENIELVQKNIELLLQKWYATDLRNRTQPVLEFFKKTCSYPEMEEHLVFKAICNDDLSLQKLLCKPEYQSFRSDLVDFGVEELRDTSSCPQDNQLSKAEKISDEELLQISKECVFEPHHDFRKALLKPTSTITLFARGYENKESNQKAAKDKSSSEQENYCQFVGGYWAFKNAEMNDFSADSQVRIILPTSTRHVIWDARILKTLLDSWRSETTQ